MNKTAVREISDVFSAFWDAHKSIWCSTTTKTTLTITIKQLRIAGSNKLYVDVITLTAAAKTTTQIICSCSVWNDPSLFATIWCDSIAHYFYNIFVMWHSYCRRHKDSETSRPRFDWVLFKVRRPKLKNLRTDFGLNQKKRCWFLLLKSDIFLTHPSSLTSLPPL